MKKHKGHRGKQPPMQKAPRAAPTAAQLAPSPGPNEFDAGAEQAMRMGQRQANMAPAPDGDDMGGLGGP